MKVIAFNKQVAGIRGAGRQLRLPLEKSKWHFTVMIQNGTLADPVKRWHQSGLDYSVCKRPETGQRVAIEMSPQHMTMQASQYRGWRKYERT